MILETSKKDKQFIIKEIFENILKVKCKFKSQLINKEGVETHTSGIEFASKNTTIESTPAVDVFFQPTGEKMIFWKKNETIFKFFISFEHYAQKEKIRIRFPETES